MCKFAHARTCLAVDILKVTQQGAATVRCRCRLSVLHGVYISVTWRIRLNRPAIRLQRSHCWSLIGFFQGRNHWGSGGPDPPNLEGPPQLFDDECDYHYVTDCSARIWVHHPYFVLYNNLDQGIGPPNFDNVVAFLVSSIFFAYPNGAGRDTITCKSCLTLMR